MKQIGLIILTLLFISSCQNKSTKDNKSKTIEILDVEKTNEETPSETSVILISDTSKKDSLTKTLETLDYNELISDSILLKVFKKAIQCFPKDSASLCRFYLKWNLAKDQDKVNKQITRLQILTSKKSVERYRNIENNLHPLLIEIVNSKMISSSQSDSLVNLYSDYDYFSGESLFSYLITNDENYTLIWESFKLMVNESSRDTCFISGLIKLNNNIRTNVELSEALEDFKVKAISNNPLGFLDMYNRRQGKQRNRFAYNITVWDDPKKEIMDMFTEISLNSTNENYRQLSTELINHFKVE